MHFLRNPAGMSIQKTNPLKPGDFFSHFRNQLQGEIKFQIRVGRRSLQTLFPGLGKRVFDSLGYGNQEMPGDPVVLAVRVTVAEKQCFPQKMSYSPRLMVCTNPPAGSRISIWIGI